MILKLVGFAVVGVVAAWVLYDRIDAPRLLVPHDGRVRHRPRCTCRSRSS